MLLPALGKARESGRKVSCASSLRQIMSAEIQYGVDYEGYFFAWKNSYSPSHIYALLLHELKYLPLDEKNTLVICPSLRADFDAVVASSGLTARQKIRDGNCYGVFNFLLNDSSTAYIAYLSETFGEFYKPCHGATYTVIFDTKRLRNASKLPMLADTRLRWAFHPQTSWLNPQYRVSLHHNNTANVAYADGHVKSMGANALQEENFRKISVNGVDVDF